MVSVVECAPTHSISAKPGGMAPASCTLTSHYKPGAQEALTVMPLALVPRRLAPTGFGIEQFLFWGVMQGLPAFAKHSKSIFLHNPHAQHKS